MTYHPYAAYIETKAADYYGRQIHEPHCETLQPYKVPTNERTGETYDVYIIQHCDCWLTVNFEDLTLERKFQAMRNLSYRYGLHSPACSRLKKTPILYRNKPEFLTYPCDCWLSVPFPVDKPKPEEYTEDMTTDPVADLKARVDQVRENALGPHLDTPIYDQLAREYDAKYSNMQYFDTELAKRLELMGKRHL